MPVRKIKKKREKRKRKIKGKRNELNKKKEQNGIRAAARLKAAEDEANLRLAMLGLEICRDPLGLSAEELAGAWNLLSHVIFGGSRPSVITAMVEAGVLEAACAGSTAIRRGFSNRRSREGARTGTS